jgi:hypothetical protein
MPHVGQDLHWWLFVNTAADRPDDVYLASDGPSPASNKLLLIGHSLVCYVAG